MNTIEINGTVFTNHGVNNYSKGMELISIYPAPKNIVQDVLDGKYPGVYLNPSAECNSTFYGVLGTPEQYEQFYNSQKESCMANEILGKVNYDWSNYKEVRAEVESQYKDWWEE